MKISDLKNSAAIISKNKSVEFEVNSSASFLHNLSDTLYSNKASAIIREILCNAWDAHVAANVTDTMVDVTFKDKVFTVRDFGNGISKEDFLKIYGTYGSSTKEDSSDQTGGFGLGSKSPFALVDVFQVISTCNGYTTGYLLTKFSELDGKPAITELYSYETDKPSGLTVIVDLNTIDEPESFYTKFKSTIVAYIKGGLFTTAFNGEYIEGIPQQPYNEFYVHTDSYMNSGELITDTLHTIVQDPAGRYYSALDLSKKYLFVRYGSVIYDVDCTKLPNIKDSIYEICSVFQLAAEVSDSLSGVQRTLIFDAEPNKLSVTPSRESLSYQRSTIEYLEEIILHNCSKFLTSKNLYLFNEERNVRSAKKFLKNHLLLALTGKATICTKAFTQVPPTHKNGIDALSSTFTNGLSRTLYVSNDCEYGLPDSDPKVIMANDFFVKTFKSKFAQAVYAQKYLCSQNNIIATVSALLDDVAKGKKFDKYRDKLALLDLSPEDKLEHYLDNIVEPITKEFLPANLYSMSGKTPSSENYSIENEFFSLSRLVPASTKGSIKYPLLFSFGLGSFPREEFKYSYLNANTLVLIDNITSFKKLLSNNSNSLSLFNRRLKTGMPYDIKFSNDVKTNSIFPQGSIFVVTPNNRIEEYNSKLERLSKQYKIIDLRENRTKVDKPKSVSKSSKVSTGVSVTKAKGYVYAPLDDMLDKFKRYYVSTDMVPSEVSDNEDKPDCYLLVRKSSVEEDLGIAFCGYSNSLRIHAINYFKNNGINVGVVIRESQARALAKEGVVSVNEFLRSKYDAYIDDPNTNKLNTNILKKYFAGRGYLITQFLSDKIRHMVTSNVKDSSFDPLFSRFNVSPEIDPDLLEFIYDYAYNRVGVFNSIRNYSGKSLLSFVKTLDKEFGTGNDFFGDIDSICSDITSNVIRDNIQSNLTNSLSLNHTTESDIYGSPEFKAFCDFIVNKIK